MMNAQSLLMEAGQVARLSPTFYIGRHPPRTQDSCFCHATAAVLEACVIRAAIERGM